MKVVTRVSSEVEAVVVAGILLTVMLLEESN